jgi:hypothetical protein
VTGTSRISLLRLKSFRQNRIRADSGTNRLRKNLQKKAQIQRIRKQKSDFYEKGDKSPFSRI